MENFVTLFDCLFLPQAIALHSSMVRNISSFRLWVLCVDDESYDLMRRLDLPNTSLLQLSKLETLELKDVKKNRSRGEYCWTLTPFAPRFVFEADLSIRRVTYIDADIWFRKNPAPIYKEFEESKKGVLITDHGYSPEYDQSIKYGQFCVQFMIFDRYMGESVRKSWEDQCIEWCFAKHEFGKFGDQKYLDAWPERFSDMVHILSRLEWTLAPWNATRYAYGSSIFYHFHDLRISRNRLLSVGRYSIPKPTLEHVYGQYSEDIKCGIALLKKINYKISDQFNYKDYIYSCIKSYIKIILFIKKNNILNKKIN